MPLFLKTDDLPGVFKSDYSIFKYHSKPVLQDFKIRRVPNIGLMVVIGAY